MKQTENYEENEDQHIRYLPSYVCYQDEWACKSNVITNLKI